MRIYLHLTNNTELIPFNYQQFLTGALHKWMGRDNAEHGKVSLYSFSWLQNVTVESGGIRLRHDSCFFISAYDRLLINTVVQGIISDVSACFGASVAGIEIRETPVFAASQRFSVASPVLIKRNENGRNEHLTFEDEKAADCLTETMRRKLKLAGLPAEGARVSFDRSGQQRPRTKIIAYRGVMNRVNFCPVRVEGTPEQVAFAWDAGVGNSTGIGFGALM